MAQLVCIFIALSIILVCFFIRKKLDKREESRKVEIRKQMKSYVSEPNPAHISQSKPLEKLDTAENTTYLIQNLH